MIKATRRKFLRLVLTSGVTVMSGAAGPIVHSARAAVRRTARTSHARTSAALPADMRKEIANQKQYTARTLKTIREHKLSPGSPMAFVFRPLQPSRRSAR